jgi:hypothetical protein
MLSPWWLAWAIVAASPLMVSSKGLLPSLGAAVAFGIAAALLIAAIRNLG